MPYRVVLGSKATRQFKRFPSPIRQKIRETLVDLQRDPYSKSLILSADLFRLRYRKLTHQGVPYRVVFKISDKEQEIGVIFLGTRQNFYRDLKRYLRQI